MGFHSGHMANFDWHEEELRWEEPPMPEPPRAPRRWLRWLLLILLVLGGLGVGGTAVYRQLTNRVEEASFEVESAIRSSHALVFQAAQQQDRELFVTLLSGRDDVWATAQERLVDSGLFFARHGFGLSWLPGDAELAVVDVQISPDLATAVLTATHDYAIDVGNGLSQTVSLLQTAVYRRGADRWLFSSPDADFWGNTVLSQGELLVMSYPERDTAVARRLAVDIEAKINEMCSRLDDIACPDDIHLQIALSADPATLYETNKLTAGFTLGQAPVRAFRWYNFAARAEGAENLLTLPTPTLLGLPQDEASYQALYRGYAARILSALIAEMVGWACCEGDVVFQAALDMELVQLGLRPEPVRPENYTAVLGTSFADVHDAGLAGNMTYLHMLLAFMAQSLDVSPVMVQQKLAQTPGMTWLAWLSAVSDGGVAHEADLNRLWLGFVYGRSRPDQTRPPISLPEQTLQLVCRSAENGDATLYRYDPLTEALAVEWALNGPTAVLFPLPDREGLMVAEQNAAINSVARTFVFREGVVGSSFGYGANGLPAPTPLSTSPDSRYMLFYQPGERSLPYALLDWSACQAQDACELQTSLGSILWSPDGQRRLLYGNQSGDDGGYMLFLADEHGRNAQYIAVGLTAAWLDEDTAVFVREDGEVVAVNAVTLAQTALFTTREIATSLGLGPARRANLQITFLASLPQYPHWLFVGAMDYRSNFLLRYYRPDGILEFLLSQDFASGSLPLDPYAVGGIPADERFSPDGRWLVQLAVRENDQGWELRLTDWQTAVTQAYPIATLDQSWARSLVDWSSDGKWFALATDGYLRLIAPHHDYEKWFIPEHMACDQAIWLNK